MDALTLYRASNWCYRHHIPVVPKILQMLIFLLFNCYIPYQASISKSCRIGHRGIGVVINKDAVIGDNVLIRAHVTIGKKDSASPAPIIGNNVVIGDGAKIIGDITVGDDSVIGANAVVTKNVESNTVVGGVPAKVIRSATND